MKIAVTLTGAAAAFVSIFLGLYAIWRRREAPAAPPFGFMMLANAVYALAYTIELNAEVPSQAFLFLKIEYVGVGFVPVFWFLFARAFVNEARPMSLGRFALLSVVPALTLALVWTNDSHHLVYESLSLREGLPVSVVVGERGPAYWASTAYFYVLLLNGTIAIVAQLTRTSGKFRNQASLIAVAVILPWVGHSLLLARVSPYGLDPTPLVTAASGVLLAWAIFKFSLFDLVPIAREAVIDAVRDGVVVVDRRGRLVDSNEAARRIFPRLAEAELGSSAAWAFGALGAELLGGGEAGVEFSLESGGATRCYKALSLDIGDSGRRPGRPGRGGAQAAPRGPSRGRAVIITDTTEATEFLARLERLVSTDELTKVDNRRRFFEHAERELELARRRGAGIAFAMLDLDHFKRVNDEHGHAAGDAALVAVCEACKSALRSTDILCRYGGEEFMVILPEATPADALEIVERVRLKIAETVVAGPRAAFGVTASFGVSGNAGPPYEDLEVYLRRADEALYRAKAEGRNRTALYTGA